MKKLLIFLSAALFIITSCQKGDDLSSDDMLLKKKPNNNGNNGNGNGNGNSGGGNNTFYIAVPDGETDPLYIKVGESVQLSVLPDPSLVCEWYVINQQIAYVNWVGVVRGVSPGVTVVTAVHYKAKGKPLQDNIIVYVEQ